MEKYICTACGYVYDLAAGDPSNGIAPGTPFTELPEDWACPVCSVKICSDLKPERSIRDEQMALFGLRFCL